LGQREAGEDETRRRKYAYLVETAAFWVHYLRGK
jgi:hypothetical protein